MGRSCFNYFEYENVHDVAIMASSYEPLPNKINLAYYVTFHITTIGRFYLSYS